MVAKKVIIPSAKFSRIYSSGSSLEYCFNTCCSDCPFEGINNMMDTCKAVYDIVKDNLVVIEEVLED